MDKKTYLEKMEERCKCGHSRGNHGHNFSKTEEGQPMREREVNRDCEVNECRCKKYEQVVE